MSDSIPDKNVRFTMDSIDAASYIYEDCKTRGQSQLQAMKRSVGRLVEAAPSAIAPSRHVRDLLESSKAWLEIAVESGISNRDEMNLPTPNADACARLVVMIEDYLRRSDGGSAT